MEGDKNSTPHRVGFIVIRQARLHGPVQIFATTRPQEHRDDSNVAFFISDATRHAWAIAAVLHQRYADVAAEFNEPHWFYVGAWSAENTLAQYDLNTGLLRCPTKAAA